MAARKISISMEEELVDEVQIAAEEAGMSVSAWIAEQARERIMLLGWKRLIADFEAENGAFTDEEKAEAKARLDALGMADRRRPIDQRRETS